MEKTAIEIIREMIGKLPEINIDKGLATCVDDEDFYIELFTDFVNLDIKEQLVRFMDANDHDNYCIRIHGFKNNAYSVGATALGDLSYEMEKISREALTEEPTVGLAAAEELLMSFLDSGKIDLSRVYSAGISMGGYGTWELITRRPELFAASIPVCGAGIPSLAHRLTDIAIWAFHGDRDDTVPASGSRDMYNAITAAGGTKVKYTELPGVWHDSWIKAYKTEGLIEWLYEQHK
jgi:dienelactone hydrolase